MRVKDMCNRSPHSLNASRSVDTKEHIIIVARLPFETDFIRKGFAE